MTVRRDRSCLPRSPVRRRRRDDRGSVTLEYAIVVPAVLALIFVCVQVALYSYARSVALTAAEEAVNAQRVYGAPAGAGSDRANYVLTNQQDAVLGWTVTVTTVGGRVQVTVTGRSLSVFPGVSGYPVHQTASGPVERFVP
jgi:Flp pilus assembly protein TadG